MIWKIKLKKSKLNRPFTKSDVYTLKFKQIKWERNRSVPDNPTRWADTVRNYWLRFYGEIYLKPDSHKIQRHEGELKANGKSYFGASIHFLLMTEIKAPCRGEFRVFRSKLIRSDRGIFTHLPLYYCSPDNDIQQKPLSNVSKTKFDHMLISEFPQKVKPIRNCSFFSSKILFYIILFLIRCNLVFLLCIFSFYMMYIVFLLLLFIVFRYPRCNAHLIIFEC